MDPNTNTNETLKLCISTLRVNTIKGTWSRKIMVNDFLRYIGEILIISSYGKYVHAVMDCEKVQMMRVHSRVPEDSG